MMAPRTSRRPPVPGTVAVTAQRCGRTSRQRRGASVVPLRRARRTRPAAAPWLPQRGRGRAVGLTTFPMFMFTADRQMLLREHLLARQGLAEVEDDGRQDVCEPPDQRSQLIQHEDLVDSGTGIAHATSPTVGHQGDDDHGGVQLSGDTMRHGRFLNSLPRVDPTDQEHVASASPAPFGHVRRVATPVVGAGPHCGDASFARQPTARTRRGATTCGRRTARPRCPMPPIRRFGTRMPRELPILTIFVFAVM